MGVGMMFMWDLRDVSLMRKNASCESGKCMRDAFHMEVWDAREEELRRGADRKLISLIRTSVADEAVIEMVL